MASTANNDTTSSDPVMVNSASENERNPKRKRQSSAVWEYFSISGNGAETRRKCLQCSATFSINSATTTLAKHARRHGFLLENDRQARFGSSGNLQCFTPLPRPELEAKVLSQLSRWIVSGFIPLSVTEDKEFVRLLHLFDASFNVPSRRTTTKRIHQMLDERSIQIKSILATHASNISITTDAWSSRIFKGYIAVTAHWIDDTWSLRSILLDFQRFSSPHTGESTATMLLSIFERWGVCQKIRTVTSDNASDMCVGVNLLRERLQAVGNANRPNSEFHVRCLAHVINLAVKSCLELVRSEVHSIRKLINSLRASVKRRELFDRVRTELGERKYDIPSLDVETRWNSTFYMVQAAYKCRHVLSSVIHRVPELGNLVVTEEEWERAARICEFLSTAASVTEYHSGRKFVTLSLSTMGFKLLVRNCNVAKSSTNTALKEVATAMLAKLEQYDSLICCELAQLARILDPRFPNDLLADYETLSKFVTLPVPQAALSTDVENEYCARNLFEQLLSSNGNPDSEHDNELHRFLRATSNGDGAIDLLSWWKLNENTFPTIAKVARQVLAVPSSSVASESAFSLAGCLVSPDRTRLSDESIRAHLLLRSWLREFP